MAGEKLDGINPTRMELLNLKDRAKLSTKGHSLLKEKRDALIKEFFEILDRVQGSRDEVEKKLAIAYAELNKAQIDMGDMAVKRAALSVRESIELDISSRSIMGVSVPVVKSKSTHNDVISRGYGFAGTSANLDIAAKEFEESIKIIIELGEIEKTIIMLAKEVEATKRRVNALEHVMIPRINNTISFIEMRLEEMEREQFVQLKVIKRNMDARESE
ncbi:V-type ATP synthase subunit D [Methanosphaera sp.]|uniref:V-type ATP synthase subunit D n=1 Tax=Methanosphaera sp. TaxID=2666342 RepID=UPI00180147AA|nr:V-type ATP synthase subunit D [Methanosphaera sp.]MEE1117938.1 V-type ATP synthase subunit D [Methanosphaera sp.]MEE3323901.1 V-type ATP synthase subunit D [Methanosphaera sp.]MEE3418032.1 V-type ATP synthase subunit D [Methanosphaera sp.]HIH35321.1 V-type ATP synthase subunit D [Methanosphaera sp.]HII08112.1 V-type ATP synthase subunit D [Methanosphaera sp.]